VPGSRHAAGTNPGSLLLAQSADPGCVPQQRPAPNLPLTRSATEAGGRGPDSDPTRNGRSGLPLSSRWPDCGLPGTVGAGPTDETSSCDMPSGLTSACMARPGEVCRSNQDRRRLVERVIGRNSVPVSKRRKEPMKRVLALGLAGVVLATAQTP